MTREEKRYFKLYIKGLGKIEGHQSKLFDFLSKQEEFDASAIKKRLKSIFPSQNKSALQISTYQNILKSLNLQHASTYAETQILELLKTIKLLYVKGLYNLVIPEVEKAKKLAIEHKYVALLPQVLFWEFRVTGEVFSFDNSSVLSMQNRYEEFEQALLQLKNVYDYTKSWTQFYIYVREYYNNKEQKALIAPDYIKNLPEPIHLHSALLDRQIKTLHATIKNDFNSGIDHMMISLYEIEKSPQVIKEYFHDYVACLYRIVANAIIIKKWKIATEYLHKLEDSARTLWTANTYAVYYKLLFCYNFGYGNLKANIETSEQCKSLLKEHRQQLSLTMNRELVLAICVQAFYQENYDQCIDYLSDLEQQKLENVTMKSFIKILLMLAYYEKGEHILLPYITRSNYRYFKNNTSNHTYGRTITKYLSKITKTISKEKQIFEALHEELQTHHLEYYERTILFFSLRAWLHSKIYEVSIEEALMAYRN